MLESKYQAQLIKKIHRLFPECIILKNDTDYLQGVPDLLILCGEQWAMLEVKRSEESTNQPNQEYYVSILDTMSFAAFIYPSNETEVLRELKRMFVSY